jgi:hypothetical protein
VWCFEDGTVEFHDRSGKLLRTLRLPKDSSPPSLAA